MQITLNDRTLDITDTATLAAVLAEHVRMYGHMAVAINDRVIPRSTYADVRLSDGDHVEVVQAVGGG
ncbi:MAG: sulfur carrier protein ThiS [Deltaproteobacteria bacterium]|nr:sulfur carrier protein ThiS [Deltaproteobacteria bacterium]